MTTRLDHLAPDSTPRARRRQSPRLIPIDWYESDEQLARLQQTDDLSRLTDLRLRSELRLLEDELAFRVWNRESDSYLGAPRSAPTISEWIAARITRLATELRQRRPRR